MADKYDGKFVINNKGKAVSVLLDIKTYQKMLSGLEELESIHAYDTAKSSGDAAIPFEHAVQEIEKSRQCSTTS